ncbi:hypothetical protein [Actinomyces provencensis]|uniref:hypothetical protein n=1 Tax=Actinomyces provencensis TaxID=1720198 RepID=UPI001177855F|nr:hypothetical protein [Actinomyces provencensis]
MNEDPRLLSFHELSGEPMTDVPASREQDEDWEPIGLSAPLFGHLFTGALLVPLMVLLLWGATFLPPVGGRPFGDLVFTIVVAVLVVEILATLMDRAFMLHYRRDDPGTKLNHVLAVGASFTIGFVAGWVLLGTVSAGLACSAAVGIVKLAEVLWVRPWKHTITREEAAQKWDATKEMSREVFEDDVREVKQRATDNQRRRWSRDHDGTNQ